MVNPPYITEKPGDRRTANDSYRGTGVIRHILEKGFRHLNTDNSKAAIIMNVSSLAGGDFAAYQKEFCDQVDVKPIGPSLRVPLKIRTISDEWRRWLVEQGYLEQIANPKPGEEEYWHTLQNYIIRPRSAVAAVPRSESRTGAAVLPVTNGILLPVTVSLTELAEMGVTVRAEVRVAKEVTMGIVAPLLLAAIKTKVALHTLLASVTGHTGAMSENLAKETRSIGRMVLGISRKVFETTDAFVLGPKLLERLMENNGAGVVAVREAFTGTNIAALTDAASLKKINPILENAGLGKFFTPQELKKRLSVMKNPVIRAVILSGETLSQDDLKLLQIADKNIIPMTQRMLDNFMRVMEDLVSQLLGDQAVRHSA
jgi:hypothetical protein